ncbi:MAG: NAD-dependent epimerase/dehydratase family protein [Cellvibrionaceae bacterium]|nr:NAD-dependent epimerase/dehydratase family protein [Cellvibrionaceae bacterium]MCV6625511.1 NAD-dependent epimerase/dehydratase family protein [Cellvibrionaceae bacterium]
MAEASDLPTLPHVLLTGANGFVGRALFQALQAAGYCSHCVIRHHWRKQAEQDFADAHRRHYLHSLNSMVGWQPWLEGVDAIVHTAALAHVVEPGAADNAERFTQINTDATLNLARQAAEMGVKRFIFISTIGVHGNGANMGAINEKSPIKPYNAYTQSKLAAEQGLREIEANSRLEVVILRPALIYGPGAKANLERLMALVDSPWPLPFRGHRNRRSLLALEHLADIVLLCLNHPAAAGQNYVLCDGNPLSTETIIKAIGQGLHKPPLLLPCPKALCKLLLKGLGKGQLYEKLWGSLEVDNRKLVEQLGWQPRVQPLAGITAMATHYRHTRMAQQEPAVEQ